MVDQRRTGVWVNGSQVLNQSYAADKVVGWTYDEAGNLLSDGTTTALYDPLSRRWSTSSGGDGLSAGQVVQSYQLLASSAASIDKEDHRATIAPIPGTHTAAERSP